MSDSLRSIDLHLDHKSGTVVSTQKLRDVACGMYPVYYTVRNNSVLACTSAAELIIHLGDLQLNGEFSPPNFLQKEPLIDRLQPSIPSWVREWIPNVVGNTLRSTGLMTATHWYEGTDTIDKRVHKLRPFEEITPSSTDIKFEPTYSLSDPGEFVEQSARQLRAFINAVERRFPDHHHIARVGGMDSQLILLTPKISDNWHVFSADPNFKIVRKFIQENNIQIQNLFRHDNENEESREELYRKLICSDLQSDPRHLRWYPTLEQIVEKFNGNVIFWCGTEGDTIYSYHPEYQAADHETFFNLHKRRAANWQSITHQVTKNYTGAAAISPYHSEEIWNSLYRHYDPRMISKGDDLRDELGRRLADGPVTWPMKNPGPAPYSYSITMDSQQKYKQYIIDNLDS